MSTFETTITNPKKQLEFYKQLTEQLRQENQQLKERIHKALKLIWENYGVLDKYGIELLENILKEV